MELTIGSLNTVGSVFGVDVQDHTFLTIQLRGGAAVGATGYTALFQASLDAESNREGTWVDLAGQRSDSNVFVSSITGNLPVGAGHAAAISFNVSNYKRFRVQLTGITSGAIDALISRSVLAPEYSPIVIGTQPVSGSVSVSGNVAVTNGVLGSGASGGFKAEDAPHASGDVGTMSLNVRTDAPTVLGSATGDYEPAAVDRHGAILTRPLQSLKRTYSATAILTPIVGAIVEIAGAASTTVEIARIELRMLGGSAAGAMRTEIHKRAAVASGGTAASMTKVAHDAGDAASAANVRSYTSAPTLTSDVGAIRADYISAPANLSGDQVKFAWLAEEKSPTLLSATQTLTIELAGTVPTGSAVAVVIEWTEY